MSFFSWLPVEVLSVKVGPKDFFVQRFFFQTLIPWIGNSSIDLFLLGNSAGRASFSNNGPANPTLRILWYPSIPLHIHASSSILCGFFYNSVSHPVLIGAQFGFITFKCYPTAESKLSLPLNGNSFALILFGQKSEPIYLPYSSPVPTYAPASSTTVSFQSRSSMSN